MIDTGEGCYYYRKPCVGGSAIRRTSGREWNPCKENQLLNANIQAIKNMQLMPDKDAVSQWRAYYFASKNKLWRALKTMVRMERNSCLYPRKMQWSM